MDDMNLTNEPQRQPELDSPWFTEVNESSESSDVVEQEVPEVISATVEFNAPVAVPFPNIHKEINPSDKLELANYAIKLLHDERYNPLRENILDMKPERLLELQEFLKSQLSHVGLQLASRKIELDKKRFNRENLITVDTSSSPQLEPRKKSTGRKKSITADKVSTLGRDKVRAVYLRRATSREHQKCIKMLFDYNLEKKIQNWETMSVKELANAIPLALNS